jgi:hypothetical protein
VCTIGSLRDRQFNGYLRRRIPHELDGAVDTVVEGYRVAAPRTRRAMLDQIDRPVAGVLSAYGERMAAIAVHTGSPEPLLRALIGMGMADAVLDDRRDNLIVLAAVNHAAASVGTDLDRLIEQVAGVLPESAVETLRAFAGRSERDKSLRAMALATDGSGDTFRFVSGPTSGGELAEG